MRPEVGIAWKDVLEFFRSKPIVFWSLAFPILMMLFFGTVFGGGREYLVPVAVVDLDGSSLLSVRGGHELDWSRSTEAFQEPGGG